MTIFDFLGPRRPSSFPFRKALKELARLARHDLHVYSRRAAGNCGSNPLRLLPDADDQNPFADLVDVGPNANGFEPGNPDMNAVGNRGGRAASSSLPLGRAGADEHRIEFLRNRASLLHALEWGSFRRRSATHV